MNIKEIIFEIDSLPFEEKINTINQLRIAIHQISPFKSEPVDLVLWVKNQEVVANDYNPNVVFSPEMELLKLSISSDGYTQPIVTMPIGGKREVIDGYHRHKVGKEDELIQSRIHGYLPVVTINSDREDKADRIAATVRHNRARGKHVVTAMSDIVIELKKRNWNDAKISKHLGMDSDEVLKLCQITGIAEMFADKEFSEAWEVLPINEEDSLVIEDEIID